MKNLKNLQSVIGGKLWEKNGKSRLYLNEGNNTKKMKTTAYVEMKGGDFDIKVFIDCPSQPYSWIKKEKEKVEKSINKKIYGETLYRLYHKIEKKHIDVMGEFTDDVKYAADFENQDEALEEIENLEDDNVDNYIVQPFVER